MPTRQRFECALLLVFVWLLPACLDRPVAAATPALESALSEVISIDPGIKVDLLVMVDNSSSMRERQRNILRQLGPMIEQLTNPPCISRSTPGGGTPRPCDLHNPDETRQYPPIDDLHLAVVSSDLGTPGSTVPSCDRGDTGDDGLFNPIRNGAALREHLPWAPRSPGAERAPADLRPTTCDNNPFQFPSFIAFCSDDAHRSCDRSGAFASTRDPNAFTDWFRCNAGLFVNGCELESQLESVWRALVHHDARETSGNASPNAGFLRDDALLAIVMLSDEEDGSVRNCDNDQGFSSQNGAPCRDARAVYDSQSTSWSATGLDQRFYRYQPGGEQDPTWNLDRYYNTRPANTPNRWTRDLLSLKPGHPERIVFAGILGVPLVIPTRTEGTERRIVWDQLLGAPAAASPEDFYGRDSATAISGTQGTAGPFSMRAANPDPLCEHVVPACRTE
ncbi:MAG: hypothetical protein Q8Q09_22845, partial [Deltaproteobacteria bacterium]|nr:hypothetical protein [Deltaproteobacteria bacterium]